MSMSTGIIFPDKKLLKKNTNFYVERGRDICQVDSYHILGPGRPLRYGRDEKEWG